MRLFKTVLEMSAFSKKARLNGKSIGLVPTMGYLHEGHLSLVKASIDSSDLTVVSIFVNPVQFGKNEDLAKYPRNMKRDLALLKKAGVDVVFAPEVSEMYPNGYITYVSPQGGLEGLLEGEIRPGHFRGVMTVVAKLLNITEPDKAFFGQKDAQQCLIIKKLVRDLNFKAEILILPTVREADGLAKSSRNSYLDAKERVTAPAIYKALQIAQQMINLGERNPAVVIAGMRRLIGCEKNIKIEYAVITDPETLQPVSSIDGRVLALVAARVGKTRLIDNILIDRKVGSHHRRKNAKTHV